MSLSKKPYLKNISLKPDYAFDTREYPYNIPAVQDLEKIDFDQHVTFFVGENGAGKSTVLEAIALASGFGHEGGTRNVRIQTSDSESALHHALRLSKSFASPRDAYFLRAESFFNVASYMDQMGYLEGYGNKSLHACSHGEAFMAVLLNKLRGARFLPAG